MWVVGKELIDADKPDIHHMYILLEEAKAAARSLYELYPDPSTVEPLYCYLANALREIVAELDKIILSLP